MGDDESKATRVPVRREPPPFRRVEVRETEALSPRLVRVRFVGDALEGLAIDEPAASVRLLIPSPGTDELVVPEWNGNEFLLPGGGRPAIRTFTPRRFDPHALELDLWIVVHGHGVASQWAADAEPGNPAAVSGPGRGYAAPDGADSFLVAGDETALAAVAQLLETLPRGARVAVHLEIGSPDAQVPLPEHPGAVVEWHDLPPDAAPGDALVAAVQDADLDPGVQVWVAGEAAAVQRIRRHLRDDRALARSQATVRGYWKHGRAG